MSSGSAPTKSEEHTREQERRRGVAIRVAFFLVGLHVLAGFVMLLFYVGSHH